MADSGNYVVVNYGRNPAVNFNFMLRVEALFDLPCRAVRVFTRKNEYEKIQEGGLNDYVHLRRKPITEPFTFEVERYVGTDLMDPLAIGTDLVLPIILYVSRYGVYNGPFQPIRIYTFTGCTVMAKEYGELNAEKGGLLVETTTIGYRELICVDSGAASLKQSSTWDFATQSGSQRAKHPLNDENRPDVRLWPNTASAVSRPMITSQNETEKQPWKFDGSTAGQGKQSAKHPENDDKRAEVRAWPRRSAVQPPEGHRPEAREWPPKRSAVDIANFLSGKK